MTARAERRRGIKAARKVAKRKPTRPEQIQLQNPVADHYQTWITGNSVMWQVRALLEMRDTADPGTLARLATIFEQSRPGLAYAHDKFYHDTLEAFGSSRYVVEQDSAKGQHIVICGAGPSLNETAAEHCPTADQLWGCNSALTWLIDHGHQATHGFTVDQTPQMLAEWQSVPDVEYLLATTVHPHLTDLLISKERRYRHFHNYVGIRKPPVEWTDADGTAQSMPYEEWLYALLFPPTICTGSGLNAVTRAIDLAQFMGAAKITVLGADCCLRVKGEPRHDLSFGSPEHLTYLREQTVMHANGGHALASEASPMTLGATIDGRYWLTKADLVITAQWLVRMATASAGRIRLVGDTLPVALLDKNEAFWQTMPNFAGADGRLVEIPLQGRVPDDVTKAAHAVGAI